MKRTNLFFVLLVLFIVVRGCRGQDVTPPTPVFPPYPFIWYGGTGTFQFSILGNGQRYKPVGKYVPSVKWTCDDPAATLTPNVDTLSVAVAVPSTDTASAFILTGVVTAPDGTILTETLVIPLSAEPETYTAGPIMQTSEVGP